VKGVADNRHAHDGRIVLARQADQHVRGLAQARKFLQQARKLGERIERIERIGGRHRGRSVIGLTDPAS
jgi:hypothetical protein